jgi:hypothetical protein
MGHYLSLSSFSCLRDSLGWVTILPRGIESFSGVPEERSSHREGNFKPLNHETPHPTLSPEGRGEGEGKNSEKKEVISRVE